MKHIVSVSGGKDSTATYLRALEAGVPFRAVAADTGNEHPATYEAVNLLGPRSGGPAVEWVRRDFTPQIEHRRRYITEHWAEKGVSQAVIDRAIAALQPTGNPYVDLCLWKGRFPSRSRQFCTSELKVKAIDEGVTRPALASDEMVISWQGVRANESFERSLLAPTQRIVTHDDLPGRLYAYRPILKWNRDEVFAYAERFGVPRNPLYDHGLTRVGCFPCINASKREIALVDSIFPEQIERLEEWERLVSQVAKRGIATFFNVTNDPVMNAEFRRQRAIDGTDPVWTLKSHGIREMVHWAKTDSGGRQFNLFSKQTPEAPSCAEHGVCE